MMPLPAAVRGGVQRSPMQSGPAQPTAGGMAARMTDTRCQLRWLQCRAHTEDRRALKFSLPSSERVSSS